MHAFGFLLFSRRSFTKSAYKKTTVKDGSHKEVYSWSVDLLRCKQIIIADRKSAGDCFILLGKLKFTYPNAIFPFTISAITSTKNSCSFSKTLAPNCSGVSFSNTGTVVCATISPLSYSALTL